MTEHEVVGPQVVVLIQYRLTDDGGLLIDASQPHEPLAYLHGAGNIVPGLEEALEGRKVGERVEVSVPPEKGYGLRSGPGPQAVPRSEFRRDIDIRKGMQFMAETSDGTPIPLFVTKANKTTVWVDRNHPLAGKVLNFAVQVVGLRAPTAEELEHGHPHGPDGHAHHH